MRKNITEDVLLGYLEGALDVETEMEIRKRLDHDKSLQKTVERILSEEQELSDLGSTLRQVAPGICISNSVQRAIEEPETSADAIEHVLYQLGACVRDGVPKVQLTDGVKEVLDEEKESAFSSPLETDLASLGEALRAQVAPVNLVLPITHAFERMDSDKTVSFDAHVQRKQGKARDSLLAASWIAAVAAGILLCTGFLFFQMRYPLKTNRIEVAHHEQHHSAEPRKTEQESPHVSVQELKATETGMSSAEVASPLLPARPLPEEMAAPPVAEEPAAKQAFTIEDILAAKQKSLEGQVDALNRLARLGTLDPDQVRRLLDATGTTPGQMAGLSRFLPKSEAISLLRQALAEDPENPAFRFALTSQLMDDPASQEETFQQLAVLREMAPQNALVHYMDAQTRFAAGDYAGGLSVLDTAAKLNVGTVYAVENAQNHSAALQAAGIDAELANTVAAFYAGTDEYETVSQLRTGLMEYGAGFEAAGDYETALALYKSVEEMGQQVSRGAAYTNEYLAGLDTQMEAIEAMTGLAEQVEISDGQQEIQQAYEIFLEGLDIFAEYANLLSSITKIDDIEALMEAVKGILQIGDIQYLQSLLM